MKVHHKISFLAVIVFSVGIACAATAVMSSEQVIQMASSWSGSFAHDLQERLSECPTAFGLMVRRGQEQSKDEKIAILRACCNVLKARALSPDPMTAYGVYSVVPIESWKDWNGEADEVIDEIFEAFPSPQFFQISLYAYALQTWDKRPGMPSVVSRIDTIVRALLDALAGAEGCDISLDDVSHLIRRDGTSITTISGLSLAEVKYYFTSFIRLFDVLSSLYKQRLDASLDTDKERLRSFFESNIYIKVLYILDYVASKNNVHFFYQNVLREDPPAWIDASPASDILSTLEVASRLEVPHEPVGFGSESGDGAAVPGAPLVLEAFSGAPGEPLVPGLLGGAPGDPVESIEFI